MISAVRRAQAAAFHATQYRDREKERDERERDRVTKRETERAHRGLLRATPLTHLPATPVPRYRRHPF